MSYDAYTRRIAAQARAHHDAQAKAANEAADRRKAKRTELQPLYDEAARQQTADLAAGMDLGEAVRRMDARLAELDTIVKGA